MQTRRQLLQQALVAPLALSAAQTTNKLQVICDEDILSHESAAGYRTLPTRQAPGPLIVMAAASRISVPRLLTIQAQVHQGAWLVWEAPAFLRAEQARRQNHLLLKTFGISLQSAKTAGKNARELYVQYHWPARSLVRTFSNITPIECPPSEAIAHHDNQPVAIRKLVGKGGIVFLGSMLGPHLAAGDPEALALGHNLLELTSS